MTDLVLAPAEIQVLTGCKRPKDQVEELQKQGFYRARTARDGSVVLERAHYDAICRGSPLSTQSLSNEDQTDVRTGIEGIEPEQ